MKVRLPLVLCALAAVSLAQSAEAQDKRVTLYAGYSFLKADDANLHGLRVSPEFGLNQRVFVVGDVSFEKGTVDSADTSLTTYLAGVRLKQGIGGATVFAHALAGGARTSASISPVSGVSISVSENGLALDGGGGLEFHLKGALRLRAGADYLRRKVDVGGGKKETVNDVRATVGVVF